MNFKLLTWGIRNIPQLPAVSIPCKHKLPTNLRPFLSVTLKGTKKPYVR